MPEELPDEKVLFLSNIFPSGYMGAEMCDIEPGDTIAVWGADSVRLFAMNSACLLGAERVIAMDRIPYPYLNGGGGYRIHSDQLRRDQRTRNLEGDDGGGRGPDKCMDAMGMEAHAHGVSTLTIAPSGPLGGNGSPDCVP